MDVQKERNKTNLVIEGEQSLPNQTWSKVKKKLDSFICDSLKGRLQFRVTSYRWTHDEQGRACITVDKKEVFNMCTLTSNNVLFEKEEALRSQQNIDYDVYNGPQNCNIQDQAHEMVMSEGVFAQYDFFNIVEEYFNLPIEKALVSENILIKILSIIDRRVGKRTLKKMRESVKQEKDIVQYFYHLRCEAEELV